MDGIAKTVTVLKNPAGEAKEAYLYDGTRVERRRDDIYIPDEDWDRYVEVAQYLPHFIYVNPLAFREYDEVGGQSEFMCTCGSMAVIVGYKAYMEDASPTGGDGKMKRPGELMVCYIRQLTGKHADGVE